MLANELKQGDRIPDDLELDEAEINELLTADFLEVDDYPGLDETLAAFEHSPEYLALAAYQPPNGRGAARHHVRPLLELAAEHWLDPDDIDSNHLLELIHDIPRLRPCKPAHIPSILEELYAFWAFAARELKYPHGRACMAVLRGEAARALECALDSARSGPPEPAQLRAGSPSLMSGAGARAPSSSPSFAMVIS